MEKFQQIDWITDVEDIVDEKFVNEERLQNESSMYKLMNGNFQDPFQHLRPFIHSHQQTNQQNQQQTKSSAKQQQPKKFANNPSLGVAVKKRGRPKKKIDK